MSRPTTNQQLLRVGELAKAAGKSVRALHLYEELGLVVPVERSAGGFRLYAPQAIQRVTWISKLQDMGFSLPEIQGFLRDWEGAGSGPAGMARVRAVFEAKLEETRQALARMAALERDLVASLEYLTSCNACEESHVQSECAGCGHHGHDPAVTPDLVAGLAVPLRLPGDLAGFVPLASLTTEANRPQD